MGQSKKPVSSTLTSTVIDLHNRGYTNDFLIQKDKTLVCLQNSTNFLSSDLYITVVDRGFDNLTKSYKYVHTIDTFNGDKGLLIADVACSSSFLAN